MNKQAVLWFASKLMDANEELQDLFSKYRISEALMVVYKLFWDEFSAWYLEMVKPAYVNGKQEPIDLSTYNMTLGFFDVLLKMLHPFMPFITEELWQNIIERKAGESIMREKLEVEKPNEESKARVSEMEKAKQLVSSVRMVRSSKNIAPKEKLTLLAVGNAQIAEEPIVKKLANLESIDRVTEKPADATAFMVGTDEFAVPLGSLIDVAAEIEKQEAQLKHLEGFLAGVEKKLSNERFVQNAPEAVVAMERKKQHDSQEKIAALRESIASLKAQA